MLRQRVARTGIVCFGSPNAAAASSICLHQDSSQIADTSKSTRKLLHMAGHPSTSQCIFQEDLEIPGRLQQHQITIIYLGRPYSISVTKFVEVTADVLERFFMKYKPSLFPILHPDQLHCSIAACSICRKDAGERTKEQNAKKASASCVTLPPKGNLVIA